MRIKTSSVLSAVLVPLVFVGCGLGNTGGNSTTACSGEPPEITEKRVAAYDGSMRPVVEAKNCKNCHGDAAAAPYTFLRADHTASYLSAKDVVTLAEPASSKVVKKVLADHNCGDHGACVQLSNELISAIGKWRDGEAGLPPAVGCKDASHSVITPPVVVNLAELTTDNDRSYRWNIGELKPEFGKVWFELKGRLFMAGKTIYTLSKPKLATADRKLKIKNIQLVINGTAAGTNFTGLNLVIGAAPFDPMAEWSIVPMSQVSQMVGNAKGSHELSIKFELEETSDPVSPPDKTLSCRAPDQFQAVFDGIMNLPTANGPKCLRCHGPGGAGNGPFPQAGPGVDACVESLKRVDLNDFTNSLLIRKPSLQLPNHPVQIPFSDADKQLIYDWLTAEKANGAQ